jgi:tetratricopeptide (TPR) repeat protein
MAASIQASEVGLQLVEQARKKKGWNKKAHIWCDAAGGLSPSTLDRFWARTPISQENFVAICKAVGIESWEEIADFPDIPLLSPHIPISFPPEFSVYSEKIWVGREAMVNDLLRRLQERTRVLWITGISGIGKTTLGECLASQAWDRDPSFQWIYLEILEGQSTDFASVVTDLLARLGDHNLEPQERNNPTQLARRLLQRMQSSFYWIQLDSLERLLQPEQPTEFVDACWKTFLENYLIETNLSSRLILTAQAFPAELVEFSDRYPNAWAEIRLPGLSQVDKQLEFFAKRGVVVQSNQDALTAIARTYEGHPLVLKVIAEDILQEFAGNVDCYWKIYKPEFEQVSRDLQSIRLDETEYNEALDRKVRERIKRSLEKLPVDTINLLCRSAVFRRPVPKNFWLSMISNLTLQQQKVAYRVLGDRALIEKEGAGIRQHNLIRSVAYDLLKADAESWIDAERQAAHLWLTAYEPAADAPNLETVRGYLEAFNHYCEIEDWETASSLFKMALSPSEKSELYWKLDVWGFYVEEIKLCNRILGKLSADFDLICWSGISNAYFGLSNHLKSLEADQKCLAIAIKIGDRAAEGSALGNLGVNYRNLSDYERAIDCYQQSLTLSHDTGDKRVEGNAWCNLGWAYHKLGKYQEALDCYYKHLLIAREIQDRRGEGIVLGNLALTYSHLEHYEQAIDFYQQSLAVNYEVGNRRSLAIDLANFGMTLTKTKQYSQALDSLTESLSITREIGFKSGEAETLKNLADLHYALGEYETAEQHCQQALMLAIELGIPLALECEALKLKIGEVSVSKKEN